MCAVEQRWINGDGPSQWGTFKIWPPRNICYCSFWQLYSIYDYFDRLRSFLTWYGWWFKFPTKPVPVINYTSCFYIQKKITPSYGGHRCAVEQRCINGDGPSQWRTFKIWPPRNICYCSFWQLYSIYDYFDRLRSFLTWYGWWFKSPTKPVPVINYTSFFCPIIHSGPWFSADSVHRESDVLWSLSLTIFRNFQLL